MVTAQARGAKPPQPLAAVLHGAAKALDKLRAAPSERLARLREPQEPGR